VGYFLRSNKSDEERYLNLAHRPRRSNSFSKYRGVVKNSNPKVPYRVQFKYQGKTYQLGAYVDEVEAARVYNKAVLKIIGPYAVLNELPDNEPSPDARETADESDQ